VVLLYLPRAPNWIGNSFDEPQQRRLITNIIYVAITRSMGQLGIYLGSDNDPYMNALTKATRECLENSERLAAKVEEETQQAPSATQTQQAMDSGTGPINRKKIKVRVKKK